MRSIYTQLLGRPNGFHSARNFPLLLKDLDPERSCCMRDVELVRLFKSQGVGGVELPCDSPLPPRRLQELPVLVELHDPRVSVPAVPVGHEQIAIGHDRYRRGLIECIRPSPRNARLP